MKTFVHVLLVAACFVAYARGFPSTGYDVSDEDYEDPGFSFAMPHIFSDYFTRLRERMLNFFNNGVNIKTPDGANTTSTTKIIDGHVVTINETTYNKDNENFVFRIRTIDVKPLNSTILGEGTTVQPDVEPKVSAETVEEFNNEIPKNADTLTA